MGTDRPWLVLCALLLCPLHSRANSQLQGVLDELRQYLTLRSQLPNEGHDSFSNELVRRVNSPDEYDPNAPVLPLDYSEELTEQDLRDLAEYDVTDEELAQEEQETAQLTAEIEEIENSQSSPVKRAAILSVIKWGFTIASNGYKFYNTLTDGCGSYPDICTNRDKIETLTREIDALKARYDAEQSRGVQSYYKLQLIMDNNLYIKFHTDSILSTIKEIDDVTKRIVQSLRSDLGAFSTLWLNGSITADQYHSMVTGPLEMALGDVEEILRSIPEGSAKMLAMNLASQMLVAHWLNDYAESWEDFGVASLLPHGRLENIFDPPVSEADNVILRNRDDTKYLETIIKVGSKIKGGMKSASSKTENPFSKVKKTLFNIAKRPFAYMSAAFKNRGSTSAPRRPFSPRKIFNNFKAKALAKLKSSMLSLKVSWTKLKTGGLRQFSVKGFTIPWSQVSSTVFSAGLDALAIYRENRKWKSIDETLANQVAIYEDFKAKLVSQQRELTTDLEQLEQEYDTAFANFFNLTNSFKEIMVEATEHTEVVDATAVPFRYSPDHRVFSDHYLSGTTRDNIQDKQTDVLSLIRDSVHSDFTSAKEMLDGRTVFYEKSSEDFKDNSPVSETLSDIRSIMRYSDTEEKTQFGNEVSDSKIVCYYAQVHAELAEYDFYSLARMRPTCDVTTAEWNAMKDTARTKRYNEAVREAVSLALNHGVTSVDSLRSLLRQAFADIDDVALTLFANSLQVKDILCVVAGLKSDEYFDYFELSLYRANECSGITPAQYDHSQAAANQMRQAAATVGAYVQLCYATNHCVCFSSILTAVGDVTEEQLKKLIQMTKPDITRWCASSFNAQCSPVCVDI